MCTNKINLILNVCSDDELLKLAFLNSTNLNYHNLEDLDFSDGSICLNSNNLTDYGILLNVLNSTTQPIKIKKSKLKNNLGMDDFLRNANEFFGHPDFNDNDPDIIYKSVMNEFESLKNLASIVKQIINQ